jgi:hypothetical protein
MTASLEIQRLAQQWAEDRDLMSDEHREALLDWVRRCHDYYSFRADGFTTKTIVDLVVVTVADMLGGWRARRADDEAEELCEEAGLPVAATQDGPKEPT